MKETKLNAALTYATRGWRVFPVRADKTPLTAHGFKDASTDADQIREWWAAHPDANIAVATGPESGLVVFDVDVRPGKDGTEAAKDLGLTSSCRASTPSGGVHYYFRHPKVAVPCRVGLRPGLDVKGDRGYVLIPPSRIGERGY